MRQVDFSEGSITKSIFQTAMPMLAAQMLNLLYNIVDRVYVGRIPEAGTAALGAIGLCFPIIVMIAAFTGLYGNGGSPLFAIARGKNEDKAAEVIMNLAFVLEVGTALILMIIVWFFARPILYLFGASDAAMSYALPYIRIYMLGTVFSMTATGMNPYINAQGFPLAGMASVTVGALANIILDPVFIFRFGWGVRGAAAATVISQCISAIFVLFFLTKRSRIRIRRMGFGEVRANKKKIFDITALGTASFVMQFTNSLVQICCNNVLGRCGGDVYISIMTIVSSVRQMLELPIHAISEGSSPVISFNYGAKKPDRVKKGILVMTLAGFIYALFIWLLIILKPAFFIRIFSSDKTILKQAIPALHLYFFAFIFMTLQYAGQTTFKALNKRGKAVFFSIFRKVIIVVPLTFILPYLLGLGTDGVFMAEPVSNVIGGTACFITMILTVMPELRRMRETMI